MMLPAATSCPPKRLTPRRFECESRPLRELPPAFLCAMACLSVPWIRLRLSDAGHFDFGVRLAMAAGSFRVLAPAHLEDHYLVAQAVGQDLGFDRGAFDYGSTDLEGLSLADEEHLVEHQLATHR